jgi:hypothetical protein
MKRRLLNLLIAIDQLIWVIITLGAGSPDETISSASYRGWKSGHPIGKYAKPVIDWLFKPFEDDHCYLAYQAERKNYQLPEYFQNQD